MGMISFVEPSRSCGMKGCWTRRGHFVTRMPRVNRSNESLVARRRVSTVDQASRSAWQEKPRQCTTDGRWRTAGRIDDTIAQSHAHRAIRA